MTLEAHLPRHVAGWNLEDAAPSSLAPSNLSMTAPPDRESYPGRTLTSSSMLTEMTKCDFHHYLTVMTSWGNLFGGQTVMLPLSRAH